jgi:hypothetical protein
MGDHIFRINLEYMSPKNNMERIKEHLGGSQLTSLLDLLLSNPYTIPS